MAQTHTTTVVRGLGFFQVLFLVFLVLKLTGVITWSWWLVTMPLWGGLALIFGIILVVLIVVALISLGAAAIAACRRK